MRLTQSLLTGLAAFLVVSPALSDEQHGTKPSPEQCYTVSGRWIMENGDVLTFPTATLSDGKAATIKDISQSPFVTGVTQIKGQFATANKPCVVVIDEGLEINLTVTGCQPTGASIDITVEQSKIGEVDTKTIDSKATIQIPTVDIQKKRIFGFVEFDKPFIVPLGQKPAPEKTGRFELAKFSKPFGIPLGKKSASKKTETEHLEITVKAVEPTPQATLAHAEKDQLIATSRP